MIDGRNVPGVQAPKRDWTFLDISELNRWQEKGDV